MWFSVLSNVLVLISSIQNSNCRVIYSLIFDATSANSTQVINNPLEWAWRDYRTTMLWALLIVFVSISINLIQCLRFVNRKCNVVDRGKIIRLQPTDEDSL